MKILKIIATICLFFFSVISYLISFLLKKIWVRLTSNTYIVWSVYIVALLSYCHLLRTNQQGLQDDINVGYCNLSAVLFTLGFAGDVHCLQLTQVARGSRRYIDKFGWVRCLLFLLTVSVTSYLLVMTADTITTLVRDVSKDEIVRRFEDNIHRIKEDREDFRTTIIHPVTKGEHDPKLFHKLFRYPMEDVQMKCIHRMPWLSAGFPIKEQIIWHRNGVPLTLTDRHNVKVAFREVPEDNSLLDSNLRKYGISMYEINSTLTIHLVKKSEFGSYTCHIAKFVQHTLHDYIKMMKKLNQEKPQETITETETETETPPFPTCSNALESRVQWQDMYTWKEEFRLIRLSRRLEPIRVAPGAILSFTTSYWHLSWRDDIAVDYSVNRRSFSDLCPGTFHGCSKLLLLYWFLGEDTGWRFGVPPLHLFSIWKIPAERYHLLHCLCEHSYGYHTVKYLRKYYNRTTNQHELIEIVHPHALLVIPKEQQMLDLFVNSSTSSPAMAPSCCSEKRSEAEEKSCSSFLINEMAAFATEFFHWKEVSILCLFSLVLIYATFKLKLFFRYLGRFIKCLTLEGSMGFLLTAMVTFPTQNGSESGQPVTSTSYDIFLSYSDAESDTSVVNTIVVPFLELEGLKVFARDRDGHPGEPELQSLTRTLESSRRFLIFLSQNYFRDRFRNDFEAAMIFETLCDRSPEPNEILLIKVDQCEIPLWLRQFEVHDWTASGLTLQDHLHQLLKWLEPVEHKATFRSLLDVLMSFFPAAAVLTLLLVAGHFSYMFNAANQVTPFTLV